MNTVNNEVIAMQDELLQFAQKLESDTTRAKQLLQETIKYAKEHSDELTEGTNFRGWIYTTMRNIFINSNRVRMKEQFPHLSEEEERAYNVADIKNKVESLSKDCRIPYSMHIAGFSYKDIAEKLNIPLCTVESRISFAQKHLQSAFV